MNFQLIIENKMKIVIQISFLISKIKNVLYYI